MFYRCLFVRNARPSRILFWFVKAEAAEKQVFHIPIKILLWRRLRFGVVTCRNCEGGKKQNCPTSAFSSLHPPRHTLYTVRRLAFITAKIFNGMKSHCSALRHRGTLLPAWHRMISKRLWSTTEPLKCSDKQTFIFPFVLWPGRAEKKRFAFYLSPSTTFFRLKGLCWEEEK